MHFPTSGNGRPFVRIDGRSGAFLLSTQDADPVSVEMRDRVLDLDLAKARQGWLRLNASGADWVPLERPDDWSGTPRPTADHNAAVELDVYSPSWPEPRVRQLRASSKCVTSFVARVDEAAGEVPQGRAVRIKIGAATVRKVGKGSTAELSFTLAPQAKWPDRGYFDAAAEAEPAKPAKAAKPEPAATTFDDLENADEWA